MSEETLEMTTLPERNGVLTKYSGPRKGLGDATKLVYAWVGTYYKDRVQDITLAFAERPTETGRPDPEEEIDVEVRFDLDDELHEGVKLPPGLEQRRFPREVIVTHLYKGALSGMGPVIVPWMERVTLTQDVAPGFRQRMLVMAKSPHSPEWEVEVALVLNP